MLGQLASMFITCLSVRMHTDARDDTSKEEVSMLHSLL